MEKYLSRQQMQVIKEEAPKGSDGKKIIDALVKKGYVIEGFNDQPIPAPKTAGNTIKNAFNAGVDKVKAGANEINTTNNPLEAIEGGVKIASGAIGAAFSPLAPVFKPVGDVINATGEKLGNALSPDIQRGLAETNQTGAERVLENVADVSNIAGTVAGIKATPGAVKSIPKVASVVSDKVKQLTAQSEAQIEAKVLNNYTKGVKPSVSGQKTTGAITAYKDNVINAVKTIKDNTPNLSFTDDLGEVTVGKTPKSLQQLSEAVEQTKKTIFNQYDTLAKQAGEAGVGVEMAPIATELDTVIGNKALAITNPKAIEYAKATQARLTQAGKLDASTAQEVVQNYNKSLEAFYRNPSYDNASQAAIDAMLVNKVRATLDEGISGLTGKEYATLKKQYGALKSIEKDVIKATLRDARKGTKGLIDFTDIFSGGQVVNGILSLNPAQVASGLTQKGIAEFYKYLNNPNRAIQKMFEDSSKLPVNAVK